MSMQFDKDTGKQLKGGKLYFFAPNTVSTPQDAFKDAGLTNAHPNPLPLDGAGRVPMFYLADGAIHIRLTNASGVVQFDEMNALVIGASGGGGGVDTTDPNSIAGTGDWKFRMSSGPVSGWTRANGRTIGSAVSGAAERANADCQAQFSYWWNTFPDAVCPVPGGRGASSAADWAANKQITMPDCRFRAPFGLDDMGNSAASRSVGALFSGSDVATTPGGRGGEGGHTLTIGEIPSHDHSAADSGHVHGGNGIGAGPVIMPFAGTGTIFVMQTTNPSSNTTAAGAANITVAPTGGGGTHNNMPGFVLGTWHVRL